MARLLCGDTAFAYPVLVPRALEVALRSMLAHNNEPLALHDGGPLSDAELRSLDPHRLALFRGVRRREAELRRRASRGGPLASSVRFAVADGTAWIVASNACGGAQTARFFRDTLGVPWAGPADRPELRYVTAPIDVDVSSVAAVLSSSAALEPFRREAAAQASR